MSNVNSLSKDQQFALLFGIMAGDGCLSLVYGKKKFIAITGSLEDDIPFFKEIVSLLLKEFRGKDTKIKIKNGSIEFNFTDKRLFDSIHSYGFPIGKKGNKLTIPQVFYENNLVNFVIKGFVATDGSLVLTRNPNRLYPRIESHNISGLFTKQIYDYLTDKGMKGHFYECKENKQDLRWKTAEKRYKFQFNGKKNLLIFQDIVGFINPKHERRFKLFFNDAGGILTPDLGLMRAAL